MEQIKYVEKSYAKKISPMTRITKNQLMNIQSRSGTSTSARYSILRQSTAFVKYPTLRHSTVISTKPIATQPIASPANQEYGPPYNSFNVHQENEQSMRKQYEQPMRKESENNQDENNPPDSNENSNEDPNENQSDITVPHASTIASSNSNDDSNEDQSDITIPPASTIAPPSSNEDSNEDQSDITVPPASTTVPPYSVIQTNVFVKNPSQYAASGQKEITGLLEKEVFETANQQDIPYNTRIFNSPFVDEIKHPGTDKAFEKSRLVVQTYNDEEKTLILTQSSTIQRHHTRGKRSSNIRLSEELIKMLDVDHNFILKHHTKEERSSNVRPPEELIKMLDADHNFFLKHHSLIQHQVQTCDNRVLAAELYAMTHEFDLAYEFDLEAVIKATLSKLFQKNISLVLCTDSKSHTREEKSSRSNEFMNATIQSIQ